MTTEKIRLEIRIDAESGAPYVCDQDGRTFAGGKSSMLDFKHDDYARATITARLHANGKPMLNAGGGLLKKPDLGLGMPLEEQELSLVDPETWSVGDVVKLRESVLGSNSDYWNEDAGYRIENKTAHGTFFVNSSSGKPIEISMGIARRWFRLARKAEKVDDQGKSEERKPHKRSLGGSIREFFYGVQPPSLRDVSCGIHVTAHDVSEEATTKSYVDGDGNKFTETTYELPSSPLTEQYHQARIKELEVIVRNLREQLKERKEEAGYPAERIVKLSAAALDIIAKADIGSALIYQHADGSTTLVKRIQ